MSDLVLLRSDALVTCTHTLGLVGLVHTQSWVTIDDVPVMVEPDPEQRPIGGCPNMTVVTKPCTLTLQADRGYSDLVSIDGRPVVRDDIRGLTDGQGGVFKYTCRDARHDLAVEVVP